MANIVKVLTFTGFGNNNSGILPRTINDAPYAAGTGIFPSNAVAVPTASGFVKATKALARSIKQVQTENKKLKKRLEKAEVLVAKLKQRI